MEVTYSPPSKKRIILAGELGEVWCRVTLNHISLSLDEAYGLAEALLSALEDARKDA